MRARRESQSQNQYQNQVPNQSGSVLRILTGRSFAANRNRNLVAVFAVILTTLMFTTLFVLWGSMEKNIREMYFRQAGNDSHVTFDFAGEEEAEKIAAHELVKECGKSVVVGVAENKELLGRQVEIRYGDQVYARSAFSLPTVGALPAEENGIALDTLTLDLLGLPYELGQEISLVWRRDLESDEYVTGRFVLTGYWEGNGAAMASMAWVSREFIEKECAGIDQKELRDSGQYFGTGMLHVYLKNGKNPEREAERILADTGSEVLSCSTNIAFDASNRSMIGEILPIVICMLLVFASGYLIIYNIFQISVASDIRFYGRLKTLGAGKKQIKKIVYGQAHRLLLMGIPVGLALGYLLGTVLIPVMITGGYERATVSASPFVFLGAALFAWATVVISCRKPARTAGKVSPVEALRYTDPGTGSRRKVKKSAKGAGIFQMALANLGRNRKRTFTVICSLTLGLVLLCVFYAKNASFDIDKYMSQKIISDFEVKDSSIGTNFGVYNSYGTTITRELTEEIGKLPGLEETGRLYSQTFSHKIAASALTNIRAHYEKRLPDIEAMDPAMAQSYHDMTDSGECTAVLYGADGLVLDTLSQDYCLLEGTYDEEEFLSGKYVLAQAVAGAEEGGTETQPTYSVGDSVELFGTQYQVMGIVADLNALTEGVNGQEMEWLSFYLPAETFREIYPDNTLRKFYFNVEEGTEDQAEQMLADYRAETGKVLPATSKAVLTEQYRQQTRANTVMGFAISVIIALVGILNFINSMVTAIVSRQKEFAMIQSVGMTKRQLRWMLIDEGLFYGGITLAASCLLGALAVGAGVRLMVEGSWTETFHFTLLPLAACTPLLIGFAVLVPYLCFKNLEKQSIVERLREE